MSARVLSVDDRRMWSSISDKISTNPALELFLQLGRGSGGEMVESQNKLELIVTVTDCLIF